MPGARVKITISYISSLLKVCHIYMYNNYSVVFIVSPTFHRLLLHGFILVPDYTSSTFIHFRTCHFELVVPVPGLFLDLQL